MFKGPHSIQQAAPEPMCLPTMTQAGRKHVHMMQFIKTGSLQCTTHYTTETDITIQKE